MKDLIYVANARIPTDKAHGIAIMKMCEALASKGVKVELVVPKRTNFIKENPFLYYKIAESFKIKKVFALDFISNLGKFGFYLEALTFAIGAVIYSFSKRALIYGRDEISLAILALLGKSVIWESHTAKRGVLVGILMKRARALVVISNGLRDHYVSLGMNAEMVSTLPSGVDVEDFSIKLSKDEARQLTDLPLGKRIALYSGHLYKWKGVDVMKEAKALLPESIELITISGKKYSDVPKYLKAADALVLANTAKEDISKLHTSPLKLFEYMASERPIVAPNIPSIREIVDESMVSFFEPDNPQSLAQAISASISNREESEKKAKKALSKVGTYSWDKRAERILSLIKCL